jgi:hypothetical protein
MAAGIIAFGIGMLAGALSPASETGRHADSQPRGHTGAPERSMEPTAVEVAQDREAEHQEPGPRTPGSGAPTA